MPLISICIVAWNLERYIGECIESALDQTEEDYEIVLVDNGSEDRTVEICQSYAQRFQRIRFLALPRPTKAVRGHIEAVKHARGQYIHLIDGDDCVARNYLSDMRRMIDNHHPDLIMGTFHCIVEEGASNYMDVDLDAGKINGVPVEEAVNYIFSLTYFNRYVWRFLVRRELFDLVDFDEETKYLVGVDGLKSTLWLLHCKSIYMAEQPFYYYRRRLGSTVMSVNNRLTTDYIRLIFATTEQLLKIEDNRAKKRAFALERRQLEWYLKLFLARSDSLEDQDFKELCSDIRRKQHLLSILRDYGSQTLNCWADYLGKGISPAALKDLSSFYQDAFLAQARDRIKKDNVFLFPAGTAASSTKRLLEGAGLKVCGFLDNDGAKDGILLDGTPCTSFECYKTTVPAEKRNDYGYIISVIYEELEIPLKRQLTESGICDKNILIRKFLYHE